MQYKSLSDQIEQHHINADVAREMRADAEAFKALEREHKALQAKLEAERKAWDEQHAKQHAMNTSLHERLAEADRVVRLWAGYDANRNDRMTSAVKTAASREEAQAATLLYLMNNVE
jgi:hypothetical protein